ncbi:serine/threonine-protein kinase PknK [Vitiosangium sp. GDMCC 1.1324]|uniref:serine/threonine-protein kinase n=1 Tax=Vitiosangium sp. (strain GDMCC 1.1324) TaxID=2138576 RepID=UPI000D354C94|nr:serine/threonine-protein kinase [Vitiosangium sp. GDMCC 1.1324]PTL80480.1 serine/threonine-protein kinase PknK [Vitiosangium sp. GDMCC 1.1324]
MDSDETTESDKTVTIPSANVPGSLARGTVIGQRFTIEALTGRGGMGVVYRAREASTGLPVALKLVEGALSADQLYRFNREVALLAGLHHPGIVSFVARGNTERGQPYLVMEWLEGENLAQRLARGPLCLSEALSLLRRAAEALAIAHRQDIVHRDIKPANLFLRGGQPGDVVLVDFGLARHAVPTLMGVTGAHTVVGTPGYMAPEQASSQPEIPPAADIFSLGCVLYECLTGRPPFAAPHFTAALAKTLFADPALLHTLRPELPEGLQVLVDRMLAKNPERRLANADALLEALSALESVPELLLPRTGKEPRPLSLADAEQKLISVLLVSFQVLTSNDEPEDPGRGVVLRDTLRTALSSYGGQVEWLADGSLVATLLPERGTATDQAALAARCALVFKERWPDASVVLTTGLGVFNEQLPVGEAMDRAGRLLRQLEQIPSSSAVVMDEVTAGLLGPGFQLSRPQSGLFLLQGEQLAADASRPLLGKPTRCVGREQDLALLDFTLDSCIEEPAARALLVTAPAGVGKSRLLHEFLRRLERREQFPLLLVGRGDPMRAGASYGMLGQALRRLCGIVEGENLEVRRARLFQCVARHLPDAQAQEAVEFLGELCAIPFPEEDSPRLRAARSDPRLMSAQVGRALVAFLGAECAHQPVLLVLEDLHWSDALTVKLVEEALRELAEQPFMVLALARPEVKELFPGLWTRRLQELSLKGLSRKAGVQLVREVLGQQVSEAVVQRAVEQSDGNALFLEELIRMAAEGRGGAAPETVLAVLQARLTRMEPGVRQVLLAASIFGRSFWSGGVSTLLGWRHEDERLEEHLRQLVDQEVIEPQPASRFSAESEYRFRHALVRDAAYGLVPDEHRPEGHRRAGEWLEQMGEPDAVVLATHYQFGLRSERAIRFYTQAAERFFERHDLQGTMKYVEAALWCGVDGPELARLRGLQAVVAFWVVQPAQTLMIGLPVVDELKAGSPLWCRLMGGLIIGSAHGGLSEQAVELGRKLLRTTPDSEAIADYVEAVTFLLVSAVWSGDRQEVELLLGRLLSVGAAATTDDAMARGWMGFAKSYVFYFLEARPWQAFTAAEEGMRNFRIIGAETERNVNLMRSLVGAALAALGDLSGAVALLRESLADARRAEQHMVVASAQHYLFQALADRQEPEHQREARDLALEWVRLEDFDPFMQGMAYATLAKVVAASGELREAEPHARKACELLVAFKSYLGFGRTVLSAVLLAQGNIAEARQVAELGVQEVERMRNFGVYAVGIRLALAEACFAEGDDRAGDTALREALRCVRARASDIPEAEARERFLHQVPENARTLELAHRRWGEAVV